MTKNFIIIILFGSAILLEFFRPDMSIYVTEIGPA